MTLLFLFASYLLGAVPTSYLVGRAARGIDLRDHGSGNLGATNAFRVLGWQLALPVLLVDVFKGWFPVFVFGYWTADGWAWPLAYGIAAVIGHAFSVYVQFRGGKGVATGAGVFLALAPIATLTGFTVWLLLVLTTRIVSLASIIAAPVVAITVYLTRGADAVFWFALTLAVFIIIAHRTNIRRLLRGEEHRLGRQVEEVR